MTNQERRDRSFARIVERAVYDLHVVQGYVAPKDGGAIAAAILAMLHADGLAIHDPQNCVRKPWQQRQAREAAQEPVGRPMTVEEQIRVGLLTVTDELP